MKKLFSSILAVAVTLSAMATETAYVRMKLAGSNPTYSTSTIKLTENDERTPAYESGYDSERMMEQSNDNSVLFYAYVGTQECANIATNNLDNLVLCFNTNNIDQNYTIKFEIVSGRAMTLYDRVANVSTPIEANGTYNFSVTAEQVGRVAIKDRFVLNYVAPSYVIMSGDFDNPGGAWEYTSNFTDNGTSYSLNLDLAAQTWYHFQLEEGYNTTAYIAADGSAFKRNTNSHYLPVDGWHEQLTLYADVAGTYTFTWNDLADNLTISFPAVAASVTTNENGYASFSYENDNLIKVESDLKIYAGALNGDVLTLNEADCIPVSTGVIVYGTPNTTYNFIEGNPTPSFPANDLKASVDWVNRSNYGTNFFVLKGDALYEYVGTEFPANKAFLPINLGGAPAPKRISFRFGSTTAVENVQSAVECTKFVGEDGQVLIKRGDAVYNLQGQMVK